jgi:SAM-dependent methyltransferase
VKRKPITDGTTQKDNTDCSSLEDVIDVRTVDWNLVWQAQRAKRTLSKRDASFWDGRAASFAKAASETGYADSFLTIMHPEAHWSVLDMGCGSGILAVPLAKSVSLVTAVDLSGEMLAILRARCEDEGIDNVKMIQGRWEDDWEELGIGIHDVAIASRSMVADDLNASILKLDAIARKRIYIVTIVGDGPYDRRVFDAIGRPLNLGPDYIYNYNMLYQMGILANVAFIEETRNRAYNSPKEAFESMQWMFDGLNSCEEEKLHAYVKEHLVFRSGSWRFSYDKTVRWAAMWWEKE